MSHKRGGSEEKRANRQKSVCITVLLGAISYNPNRTGAVGNKQTFFEMDFSIHCLWGISKNAQL